MVVEVTTFRLAEGIDEEAFLSADRRWQRELVPNQDGFVRRTTARRHGAWVVVTLWATEEAARAFDADTTEDDVRRTFTEMMEQASAHTARFDTLD
jgi:heme-degrading monooxygenase HmoA